LVLQVETDLEMVIQQKNATIRYNNLHKVQGYAILLNQLFYNLINNSLKFCSDSEPSVIEITSEVIEANENSVELVKICVIDNGIGFDQSYADNIFKTFYRLHSKDKYEGTGLGLAFCKKIVERHGGTISAEGVEGKGATFIITLPLAGDE
jgi:signal transduction histidine kinase